MNNIIHERVNDYFHKKVSSQTLDKVLNTSRNCKYLERQDSYIFKVTQIYFIFIYLTGVCY